MLTNTYFLLRIKVRHNPCSKGFSGLESREKLITMQGNRFRMKKRILWKNLKRGIHKIIHLAKGSFGMQETK